MKPKKLTSYQKLKAENLALKEDIYTLVQGQWLPKLETESKWKMVFKTEAYIMAGTPWPIREGNGIWNQIKTMSKK